MGHCTTLAVQVEDDKAYLVVPRPFFLPLPSLQVHQTRHAHRLVSKIRLVGVAMGP